MVAVCIFCITLIVVELFSGLARRNTLSLAVLFLGAGLMSGVMLGFISSEHGNDVVSKFAEFVLFSVLFTDGMRVGLRERAAWLGPNGFASVVLGPIIWKSGAPRVDQLFHLVALAIAVSIAASLLGILGTSGFL